MISWTHNFLGYFDFHLHHHHRHHIHIFFRLPFSRSPGHGLPITRLAVSRTVETLRLVSASSDKTVKVCLGGRGNCPTREDRQKERSKKDRERRERERERERERSSRRCVWSARRLIKSVKVWESKRKRERQTETECVSEGVSE